ncbi:MAG: hypothetical protein KME31_21230 [Tolypothrix carrinoi HA7290-LM1]|nr:hypothetical protein [Tolypothrix carrinoi HA7290-LM1]
MDTHKQISVCAIACSDTFSHTPLFLSESQGCEGMLFVGDRLSGKIERGTY